MDAETQYRIARPEEVPLAAALASEVFDKDMGAIFPHFLCEANAEHLFVAVEDGRVVALVGIMPWKLHIAGCEVRAASMGAVCTRPEARGRGHASRLVDLAIGALERDGTELLFVSGELPIYQKRGCAQAGETRRLTFTPEQLRLLRDETDGNVAVRTYRPGDEAEMAALNSREPAHFVRSPEEMGMLLRSGSYAGVLRARQETLIAEYGGSMAGYAVFAIRGGRIDVVECAGEEAAVVPLLEAAARGGDARELAVVLAGRQAGWADRWIAASGCRHESGPTPGTVRVVNLPKLWQSLQPYAVSRIGAEAQRSVAIAEAPHGWRLQREDDVWFLDCRRAAALLLNGAGVFPQGPLKEAMQPLLPLPFVNPYNLNYI